MIEWGLPDKVLKGDKEIKPSPKRWSRMVVPAFRRWWVVHHTTFFRLAIVLMAVLALLKLGTEFWRLLLDSSPDGARDLRSFHELVHRWFAGKPVYSDLKIARIAVYPPASFMILWPFLGWLAVTPARWLWAITSAGAMVWLVSLILKESHAESPFERTFVALMPLSMNATGVTIGNGQLILHLLSLLVAGLCLTHPVRRGWGRDLLGAGLLLITLVKPNVSIPFFWIILLRPAGLRIAVLTSLGYVALTIFAVCFQRMELTTLLGQWLVHAKEAAQGGYGDLHTCLLALGLGEWILPASSIALAALGVWVYRHRDGDYWLLLGVIALFARFWTYHRLYDNLLILLPMIALFRTAKQGLSVHGEDVMAGLLLAAATLIMLAPARLLITPPPWDQLFKSVQVIVWMAILIFLLRRSWKERKKKVKQFLVNGT